MNVRYITNQLGVAQVGLHRDMDAVTGSDLLETKRWNNLQVDTSAHGVVRLQNAALDERNGEIIAHGWIDLQSMKLLRVGDYQREVLKQQKQGNKLKHAVGEGVRFPDIMLGMRGQRVKFEGNACLLQDQVFIIDGLQRVFANLEWAEEQDSDDPATEKRLNNLRVGAEVRFGTDRERERDLFILLNTARTPVSPNVILRDLRDKYPGVTQLYGLSHTDKNFALYERVSWNQRMARNELLAAMVLAKTAMALHAVVGIGGNAERIARLLDALGKRVGLNIMRTNTREFFEVLDACWGLRTIQYTDVQTHLRGNFLQAIADVFARHEDFWDGKLLKVAMDHKRKLRTFALNDPEIVRLAAAGNMALPMLRNYLIEHLNKGKRAGGRLTPRERDDADTETNRNFGND